MPRGPPTPRTQYRRSVKYYIVLYSPFSPIPPLREAGHGGEAVAEAHVIGAVAEAVEAGEGVGVEEARVEGLHIGVHEHVAFCLERLIIRGDQVGDGGGVGAHVVPVHLPRLSAAQSHNWNRKHTVV